MPRPNPVSIGYGDSHIDFEVPDDWEARPLEPKGMPRLEDPAEAVRRAVADALERAAAHLSPGRNLCYIMPNGYCTLPEETDG